MATRKKVVRKAAKQKVTRKVVSKTRSKVFVKKASAKRASKTPKRTAKVVAKVPTPKTSVKPNPRSAPKVMTLPTPAPRIEAPRPRLKTKVHAARPARVPPAVSEERRAIRMGRVPQFTYMKAPGLEHAFDVGDTVEVFCDHEKNSERVRGWIKGIVVQVDNKLVAVQFRSNVFLTDGWMVPDRILWYPLTSDQIRQVTMAKRGSRKELPDY